MLVCLATAKGAPGATTTALALTLAWPRPALMVEADPAGGDLRSGFLQGADTTGHNLLALARTVRHGLSAADVAAQCLSLNPPERTQLVLPGLPGPFHGASLAPLWLPFLNALDDLQVRDPIWPVPVDVVVDCGRLDHPHMPWRLVEKADVVVVVFRTTLPSIMAARPRVEHLRANLAKVTGRPEALVGLAVAEGAYSASEIRAIGIDVSATMPYDPASAQVLSERSGTRGLSQRSQFLRGARAAATTLRGLRPVERVDRDAPVAEVAGAGVARVHGV